eukprot:1155402-Pelagomonas_calceolata.AAC.7
MGDVHSPWGLAEPGVARTIVAGTPKRVHKQAAMRASAKGAPCRRRTWSCAQAGSNEGNAKGLSAEGEVNTACAQAGSIEDKRQGSSLQEAGAQVGEYEGKRQGSSLQEEI